jgi:hypothetical protein
MVLCHPTVCPNLAKQNLSFGMLQLGAFGHHGERMIPIFFSKSKVNVVVSVKSKTLLDNVFDVDVFSLIRMSLPIVYNIISVDRKDIDACLE